MIAKMSGLLIGLSLLLFASGCISTKGEILHAKSPGVDRIPAKLGFFPLLSTPLGEPRRGVSATMKSREGYIYIVPPTEMEFSITQESQIMTGLISTQLSSFGFSLKELPVEAPPDGWKDHSSDKDKDTFVISLELLDHLREKYDLKALVFGNVFFTIDPYEGVPPIKRVTSAHMKVVDIESLDVLGQVTFTYDYRGTEMKEVSEAMAIALAEMAGLSVE